MSARIPRKVFATPFVVTLAACGGGAGGEPPQPPTPPTTEVTPTNPPAPDDHVLVPTATPSATPPVAKEQTWSLSKNGKECTTVAAVDCSQPPGQPQHTCNPPPAVKYACPAGVEIVEGTTIARPEGKTACELRRPPKYFSVDCPKGEMCNPPPPQHFEPVPVPCP